MEWNDVTDKLREACNDLSIGQVVSNEEFTLLDSMNALELMSPKMDAGLQSPINVADWVAKKELDLTSALDVFDLCNEILLMEVAWHDGHSLATTVHSCMFLNEFGMKSLLNKVTLDPNDILSVVAFGLFHAVLKSCGVARRLVRMADIYEEEDFVPVVQGLAIGQDMEPSKVYQLLDNATMTLSNYDEDPDSKSLLLEMILFRTKFLQALVAMQEKDAVGVQHAEGLWQEMLEMFPRIGPNRPSASAVRRFRKYFDTNINHKLLASSPPRAAAEIDMVKGHESFKAFLEDMLLVCHLRKETSLHQLYSAMCDISYRDPNIVVRSAIIPMLYTDSKLLLGMHTYESWIEKDMKQAFGIPANALSSPTCQRFIESAVKYIYEVLRLLTANRARQRRNIANILPEWCQLQLDAEIYDQVLFNENNPGIVPDKVSNQVLGDRLHYSVCAWCAEWTLRLMTRHLLLGFELELYGEFEYDVVFWHLQYFLSRALENRSSMLLFLKNTRERLSKSKDEADLKLLIELNEQIEARLKNRGVAQEEIMVEAQKNLADGVLRFLIALRKEGKFRVPIFAFATDRIRFNHRFAPYASISVPPSLSYENYTQVVDLDKYEANSLYDSAAIFLTNCKHSLATSIKSGAMTERQTAQLKAMLKVVISYSVSLMRQKSNPTGTVEFSFNAGSPYPIVS